MTRQDSPTLDQRPASAGPAIIVPDEPDLPGRSWSLEHAKRYMASRPKRSVHIPLEPYHRRDRTNVFVATWNGHHFGIPIGRGVLVADHLAEIVEHALAEDTLGLRTAQAQQQSEFITPISDGGMGRELAG